MPFFVFRTMRDYTVLDVGPNRYDGASAIYFESLVVVCKITYIWKPRVFRSKKECGWQGREKIGVDCVKNYARLCSVIAPFRFKCISSSRFVGSNICDLKILLSNKRQRKNGGLQMCRKLETYANHKSYRRAKERKTKSPAVLPYH